MIGDEYYKITMPLMDCIYKEKYVEKSVNATILDFLKRCYTTIPYRETRVEIRNIPYIVMKTSRNLEDNFLMFYRFIECFYKNRKIKNFVTEGIKKHYKKVTDLSDERIEKYSREIICLRNQYVHSGYFIKDASLEILYPKINHKKNPKDYTVKNLDAGWIYERTKLLYDIVIDIIFKELLGFDEYIYKRHF